MTASPPGEKPGEDEPEQDFVGPEMQDATGEGQAFSHQFSVKKTKGGDPMIRLPDPLPDPARARARSSPVTHGPS